MNVSRSDQVRWKNWVFSSSVAALRSMTPPPTSIAAWNVSPELGQEYLGTQGDQWDAQKDMGLAMLGTAIATLTTPWIEKLLKGRRSGATK